MSSTNPSPDNQPDVIDLVLPTYHLKPEENGKFFNPSKAKQIAKEILDEELRKVRLDLSAPVLKHQGSLLTSFPPSFPTYTQIRSMKSG